MITKLKSREELERLATTICDLVYSYQGTKAVDLLQQLQEETVRCCDEQESVYDILALLQPQPEKNADQ